MNQLDGPLTPLHASHLPRVTYFFGVPGAGKSFLAELLSRETGVFWYEADQDLPPDVRQSIAEKRAFTEDQRDRMYLHIRDRIAEFLQDHERVIVSQATFKRRHREMLERSVEGLSFIWVQASESIIKQRLTDRADLIDPEYGTRIAQMFEPPEGTVRLIKNEGAAEAALAALRALFGEKSK